MESVLKSGNLNKSTIIILSIITALSIIPRLFYFPNDIPLILDSLFYFKYAIDASILGQFPSGYPISNNGWPLFLSMFFSIYDSENFLDFMQIQRYIAISCSIFTIPVVFLLCSRFFNKKYSLIGAVIFAFEPRVIQNSLLGITEPLFVFLTTLSMFFFLSKNQKIIFVSFAIIALGTLVRYEGILLFFAFTIIFFIRFRKEKFVIKNYLIGLSIFILILLPIQVERIETTGSDGIADSVVSATITYGIEASSENGGMLFYIQNGLTNLVKLGGWSLIPSFILFVPLGFILLFKREKSNRLFLILTILALLIPPFYAFSRGIQETRYFIVLYPIFCILSLYSLKFFDEKLNKKFISIIIVVGIILISVIFLDWNAIDNSHEKESFEIAQKISHMTIGVNSYHPESTYLRITNMTETFPKIFNNETYGPTVFQFNQNNIEEFIKNNRDKGLSHIVVDENLNRNIILNELFFNEKKFPFLIKTYDSSDDNFTYHVKLFEINYEKFDQMYK